MQDQIIKKVANAIDDSPAIYIPKVLKMVKLEKLPHGEVNQIGNPSKVDLFE